MRAFTTAAREADGEILETDILPLDDRDIHFRKPTPGQVAVYMADTGRRSTIPEQIAATVDFFMGLFEESDRRYLADRLLDPHDPFEVEDIRDIMREMVEEWSGRPTERSSGSTASRRTAGKKSTPRTPARR